ncbi:MAG: aliphatic sulfonate ABC transporter substrate-binding protein [Treponema sp.]|nr:aliphatic sulfonate ABC transporter substrate-binding protein [Treponema sp.]
MKHTQKALFLLIAVYFFVLSTGCTKKEAVSPRTVHIAIQPSAAFIPLYIARYTKSLENALAEKKVSVEWEDFESGPSINESLFADMSDIGLIGDVPTVLALEKGNRMKLVGVPARGPNAYALLVRKDDTSISSIEDLRGKKLATVFGSTGHNFTKKLLEKSGIGFEGIEFCNISAGEAETAIASKAVDAIVIWEPNVSRIVDKGLARILVQGEDINLRGSNGFVVREEFLSQNKDIVRIILQEYEKAAATIDSLDSECQIKLAQALKIEANQLLPISKKYDYSVAITEEDKAAFQDTISFLVAIGNLVSEYKIENAIEPGLL